MTSTLLQVHLPRSSTALVLPSSSLPCKFSSTVLFPFFIPHFSSPRPLVRFRSRRLFSSLSPPPPPAPWFLPPPSGQVPFSEEPEEDEPVSGLELCSEGGQGTKSIVLTALPRLPSPKLSIKEKKELASYAHSLGKKLKSQQVGKSGVTPSVATAFVETLEANELLKLKVHGNCPGELSDIITQLEQSTGSVVVGKIGRSVILYRPSLSKMQKKDLQNTQNASSTKSYKAINSKVHKNGKVFAHHSR